MLARVDDERTRLDADDIDAVAALRRLRTSPAEATMAPADCVAILVPPTKFKNPEGADTVRGPCDVKARLFELENDNSEADEPKTLSAPSIKLWPPEMVVADDDDPDSKLADKTILFPPATLTMSLDLAERLVPPSRARTLPADRDAAPDANAWREEPDDNFTPDAPDPLQAPVAADDTSADERARELVPEKLSILLATPRTFAAADKRTSPPALPLDAEAPIEVTPAEAHKSALAAFDATSEPPLKLRASPAFMRIEFEPPSTTLRPLRLAPAPDPSKRLRAPTKAAIFPPP
jgi:hypothetical protein